MPGTDSRQDIRELLVLAACFLVILCGALFLVRDFKREADEKALLAAAEAAREEAEKEEAIKNLAVNTEGISSGPYTQALRDFVEREMEKTSLSKEQDLTLTEEYAYVRAHWDRYPEGLAQHAWNNPDLLHFLYTYGTQYDFGEKLNLLSVADGEVQYTEEEMAQQVPYFYQWDERWAFTPYGSSVIGITGCGPTCLSMVMVALTGDTSYSPRTIAKYAEENGYYEYGDGTRWSLMQAYAFANGLSCKQFDVTKDNIRSELEKGHYLICSVGPGYFTSGGHFIVITDMLGDTLSVHDPNSRKNSERRWRYEDIRNQIWGGFTFSTEDLFAEDGAA
ncbi:MAG: C39 family peptidase [Lachnospiraceae bacterium]|nr:C39 family peptidase [Lachnospiraceae bacterium]